MRYGVAIRWFLAMWLPGARRTRTAAEIAAAIPDSDWQRVSWAEGTKGPLAARFVARRVRPAKSRSERWLLCERSLADDERKYYVLNLDATIDDITNTQRIAAVYMQGVEVDRAALAASLRRQERR